MRVFYDTNALVKVLSRREGLLSFKRHTAERHIITNVTSPHILSELEIVLSEKMKLTKQKAKVVTCLLERQSVLVHPKAVEKICRDPFDDYVLASAAEGKDKYLVTDDED